MVDEKPFRDMTPDEVAEATKRKVGTGVAKVTDAAERTARKTDDAKTNLSQGVRATAHTTRELGGTAAREAAKIKDALDGDAEKS